MEAFLENRGINAELERDFVDVRWMHSGRSVIGEVKVTEYLTLDEAFRAALGQLLFYAHVQFSEPPIMVMFLDKPPHAKRLELTRRLDITLVVETAPGAGVFRTCGESGCERIRAVFA